MGPQEFTSGVRMARRENSSRAAEERAARSAAKKKSGGRAKYQDTVDLGVKLGLVHQVDFAQRVSEHTEGVVAGGSPEAERVEAIRNGANCGSTMCRSTVKRLSWKLCAISR